MKGNDEEMLMHAQNLSTILPQEVHFMLLSVPGF